MLRFMTDPDGTSRRPDGGLVPRSVVSLPAAVLEWKALDRRDRTAANPGVFDRRTFRPAPRKLGTLDSFAATVAFIISSAGVVASFAGINPNGIDPPPSPSGVYPPFFNYPALSIAGIIAAACGVILSVFALYRLRNTEGDRHDLLRNLAKAGAIIPVAVFGCAFFLAAAAAPA